jgi:L-ascorbate metabolism protein UlaG (beta-lactamase superfamily)
LEGGYFLVKITWYGHAAVKVELENQIIFVDPMLNYNPNSPIKAAEVSKADAIYVTHDHKDHLGDAFDICKRTGAVFIAVYELAEFASQNGVKNTVGLNIGGSTTIGPVKLSVVQAVHSSSKGAPTGVIIQGEGATIYHAGDTALFGDMKLFGDRYKIDLACIPIGGNYTMDADQAAEAVKMLNPKTVLPIHFATFPVLAKDSSEFLQYVRMKAPNVRVLTLSPGESYEIKPMETQTLA